jgi:hypothetical protein
MHMMMNNMLIEETGRGKKRLENHPKHQCPDHFKDTFEADAARNSSQ